MNLTVYIKAPTKVTLYNKSDITIGDILSLYGDESIVKDIESTVIKHIMRERKQNIVISILDVIKAINENFNDLTVLSIGQNEVLVVYHPQKDKENKFITFLKVVTVCLILICGSALAIMTFHTDAAVPNVFVTVNEIFTGEYVERPFWIIIPYSIGLLVGVVVFFNHFSNKMISEDPTPIQVEMNKYEDDVNECLITALNNDKNGGSN